MHHKDIEEILKNLNTTKCGLSESEATDRLNKNGKNIIEKNKKQSLIIKFLAQFKNIMVIILLISAIISITISIVHSDLYELIEGFVILFIVFMNACIGVFQENKAQACLDELEKKTTNHTTVLRSGKEARVLATDIVSGDIVVLQAGDVVPADIRLLESNNLACDESSLTGESLPIEKNADLVLNENTVLAERKNMVYSGSLITSGKGLGVVVKTGNETEMGKIAKMLITGKKTQTPLQKSIAKIGKFITITVLSVCLIIFILELFCVKDSNFISALMTAVALAVAGIPESLPAVITLIMALGVMQLARRKVIIKRLHAVETLGSCEIICSDKTGTLTQNKMQVIKIVDGKGNDFHKTSTAFKKLVNCMYLCNEGKIEKQKVTAEPTEKALLEFSKNYYDGKKRARIKEICFDSTRKMMSTLNKDEKLCVYTKGALDKVLDRCKFALINDEIVEMDTQLRAKIEEQNSIMANSALRVLAFCYKELDVEDEGELENNLIFIGLAGLRDEPRPEVKDAIKRCFKAGMKPVMITGDHKLTAYAIAKDLGIAKTFNQVLTGEEINKMSDEEFFKRVNDYTVFARVTAEHKVKIVKAYKKLDKIVAMTGDGVNDAPSLKIADIGVGMGISGTEVAKSVSDMIITDDNFNSIIIAVEEGRKVYSNIQKALQYLMSTNAVEIFGMLFSLIFFPNNVFLLPSQMLFVNLVTDSLPAFALGMEKAESEIMEKPPRKLKSNLLSDVVGVSIIYQAILQMIIIIFIYCGANRYYTPEVASTMVFFTIIWMQLLHSINCKTNQSILGKNLLENKTFNICFIITFLANLLVCILPISYTIFGLATLNLNQWLWIILASLSIIPLCEIVKLFGNENIAFSKKLKTKRIKKHS